VVLDQIDAALLVGLHVEVLVNATFDLATVPEDLRNNLWVKWTPCLPHSTRPEDAVDEACAAAFAVVLEKHMAGAGTGTVISHDLLFQGHFLSQAKGWHTVTVPAGWTIWHLAHSRPGKRGSMPWWRSEVPLGHRLLALSETDRQPLAEYYGLSTPLAVDALPNARGLCRLMGHDPWVREFTSLVDLESPELVVVYPFSLPRWKAKGVDLLLSFCGALAEHTSVRVVLVAAHANAPHEREVRRELDRWARLKGLAPSQVCWTMDHLLLRQHSEGISAHCVGQLQQWADLFVLPSMSEAAPLCLAEALQAGVMCVVDEGLSTVADWPGVVRAPLRTAGPADLKSLAASTYAAWRDSPGHCRRMAHRMFGLRRLGADLLRLARTA
jgi:hypothetical protein